jgi:glycosyltransferase involved in cell wall biosynthesis
MKKYLVVSNDFIYIKKHKVSSDFNDTVNIISAIEKKFQILLYSRISKSKNSFSSFIKKKIIRVNLLDLFSLKKINIFMISITPRNFIFLLFSNLILRDIKGYVILRSNGHKEYYSKLGIAGIYLYDLMFKYVIKKLKIISVSKNINNRKNNKYLFPSELNNSWFKNKKKVKTKIPLLLYFGRFRKEKGIYSLIDLVENLDINFKLTIAGDDRRILVKKKNINLLDKISNKQKIINLYDKHNIFILPSYTEGAPKVVLESLARMRPIIVFNDISHIKLNFKGIFVCDRNVDSLEKTIKFILRNFSTIQTEMKKNNLTTKKIFQNNLIKILNV